MSVQINSSSQQLLTGSKDGTAMLFEIKSFKALMTYTGHKGWVNSAKMSDCMKQVVTGSSDMSAILWDAYTGGKIRVYKGHNNAIGSVSLYMHPNKGDIDTELEELNDLVCNTCVIR